MRGKKAKQLRTLAGFKPGTRVRKFRHNETGQIVCGRPRSTYQQMKKNYKRKGERSLVE